MRKKIPIVLSFLALALGLWFFLSKKTTSPPEESSKKKTEIADHQKDTISEEKVGNENAGNENEMREATHASYAFILEPVSLLMVKFPLAGKFENPKNLGPGDHFSKNTLLFQLDNSVLFADINRKKKELKSKLEGLYQQIARETPEAYPKWQAYGEAISETELLPALPENISSKERALINESGIVPLSLEIQQKEQEIFSYFYLAPFDGRIHKIFVHPGKQISAQQTVAVIYKNETVLLQRKIHREDLEKFLSQKKFRISNSKEKKSLTLRFKAGKHSGDSVIVMTRIAAGKLKPFNYFETVIVSHY